MSAFPPGPPHHGFPPPPGAMPHPPQPPRRPSRTPKVLTTIGIIGLAASIIIGGVLIALGATRIPSSDSRYIFYGSHAQTISTGEEFMIYSNAGAPASDACVVFMDDEQLFASGILHSSLDEWEASGIYTAPRDGIIEITCNDDGGHMIAPPLKPTTIFSLVGGILIVVFGVMVFGILLIIGLILRAGQK